MNFALILAAVAVAMLLPIQPGANAVMREHAGSALAATTINFLTGLVLIAVMLAILRPRMPSASELGQAPWWAWAAGLIGALFVVSSLMLAPRLGAVLFLAALVAGQAVSSLWLDHYGLCGYSPKPITPLRLLGTALVIAGMVLVGISTRSGPEEAGTPVTGLAAGLGSGSAGEGGGPARLGPSPGRPPGAS